MSPILQGLANGSVRGYGGYLPLGPSGAFESIASTTLSSAGTITFSNIPSTYQHLQIRFIAQQGSTEQFIRLQFNSDTGSNYAFHNINGSGSSVSASGQDTVTNIRCGYCFTTSDIFGVGIIDIHDYASTTKNKTVRSFAGYDNNSSATQIYLFSGLWSSTSAITSIKFDNNGTDFASGTAFALYGIKGA